MKKAIPLLVSVPLFFAVFGLVPARALAVDAAAAEALMKSNKCNKCHSPEKERSGPSLKKISARYKGNPDGEQQIIKTITTGPTVKSEDGSEEEHMIIKTKDPAELKNLAQWILSH